MQKPDDVAITFGALNGRLQTLVEGLIASGKDPNDPTAGLYISGAKAAEYAQTADASPLDRRLALAAQRLGLDVLETAVLALCAAPQLDPRYAPVYAFLHDDVTRKLPSPRLVADVLDGELIRRGDVLGCFRAQGRLRRLGCIELVEEAQRPFIEQPVKLAPPLASFLLDTAIDERARDWRVRTMTPPDHDIGRAETIERIGSLLRQASGLPLLVAGPDAPALLSAALGAPLLLADARFVDDSALRRHAALLCALEGHRLAWEGLDDLDPEQARRVARVLAGSREQELLCAQSTDASATLGEAPAIVVEVPEPTLAERRAVWRTLSGTPESEDVAAKFRLSVGQVEVAAEIARTEAAADGRDAPTAGDLEAGARLASSSRLGQLAARVPPAYEWRDLVLPERLLRMLRSISGYLRHRDQVLSEWGYGRRVAPSQGLKVLFAGDSGTGKTMAAQVLANDLGLELFRVDLATIVSKYIGETEKNLDRIFGAAERCERDPVLRRGRCAVRQALGGVRTRTTATRTSRSRTCSRRWRGTRARSSSRRTSRRTSTTRSSGGLTSRSTSRSPSWTTGGASGSWCCPTRRRSLPIWTSTSWRRGSSSRAARSATARSPRRSSRRPRTCRSGWTSSSARSRSSTASRAGSRWRPTSGASIRSCAGTSRWRPSPSPSPMPSRSRPRRPRSGPSRRLSLTASG